MIDPYPFYPLLKSGNSRDVTSDIDCSKLASVLSAEEDVKKYRQKLYDLVEKGICPKSPKPNSRQTHKDEINKSTDRIQDLKDIRTQLGC